MNTSKLYTILAFLSITAVLIYGVVKGWFTSKKIDASATGNGFVFPNISTGSSSFSNNGNYSGGGTVIVVPETPPNPLFSLTNILKTLVRQTGINNLNLNHFGVQNTKMFSDNGRLVPKWGIYFDGYGTWFKANNIKPWQAGFAGCSNVNPVFYDGFGVRGIDFVYNFNPDTGQPWSFDPVANASYDTFVSAIPPEFRLGGQTVYMPGSFPFVPESTLEQCYTEGLNVGKSSTFGHGDDINGKANMALIMVDNETNYENGDPKNIAFMLGMVDGTVGRVTSLYHGVIYAAYPKNNEGIKNYASYPDSSGNFVEGALINADFLQASTISIPSLGITNRTIFNETRITPSTEMSLYYGWLASQGSNYPLNNSGDYVTVNKFGNSPTVQHPMAALGFNLEVTSYFCQNKLNGRRNQCMTKLVADRENLGIGAYFLNQSGNYVQDSLPSHQNRQIGRKYGFLFGLLTFINKIDWYVWDKALTLNEASGDTYASVPALYKMLDSNGCIDAYQGMTPQLWDTEYSLDGGTTWLKTKALDWDVSTTTVLPVRSMVSATQWILTAFRPEGVEPVAFKARATVGGVVRYAEITADSWETTSEQYSTTPLGNIPTVHKDYYCNIFTYS